MSQTNRQLQTSPFHRQVIATIKEIPKGKVASYGQIARHCGHPRSARQVARFLHSSSRKYRLPWHRVVNSQRKISLPEPLYSQQLRRLRAEGVEFDQRHCISKDCFVDLESSNS